MNTLSWNYQGLRNPHTVNALKKIVQAEDPSLVFLMETKLPLKAMKRMSNIKNSRVWLFQVKGRVVVLLYFGNLKLKWILKPSLVGILMQLLTLVILLGSGV